MYPRFSLVIFRYLWSLVWVLVGACASREPASPAIAEDIAPPPPFRTLNNGRVPPVVATLSLTPREREFATILLEGAFEGDEARLAAFDKLINRMSEMPRGELFDLYESRWKSKVPTDSKALQDALQGLYENEELTTEVRKQFVEFVDNLIKMIPLANKNVSEYLQKSFLLRARNLSNAAKISIVKGFEPIFKQSIDDIGKMLRVVVSSDEIKIQNKAHSTMFKILLVEYFDRLKFEHKKSIIRDLLTLPSSADFYDRVTVLVQNAGPQFQKMMQAVARDPNVGTDMGAMLSRLETGVKNAPFEAVHKSLLEAVPEIYPKLFVTIDYEPIGSGTMAQIHRAEIRQTDGSVRKVAVRILKPWAGDRLLEDAEIFKAIVPMIENHPDSKGTEMEKFSTFANGFQSAASDEMNAEITFRNQEKASSIYTSVSTVKSSQQKIQIRIQVPAVYQVVPGKISKRVLIQELVPGISLSKFFEYDPASRKMVAEFLAEMWIREAVFGSGFFHSDLHQGNVLVQRMADGSIQLALLDYGMVGQLSPEQRGSFLRLTGALVAQDTEEALRSINLFLVKPIDEDLLRKTISEVMKSPDRSAPAMMTEVIRIGGEFPVSFTSFARGNAFVTQMLRWAGSTKTVDTLSWELAVKGLIKEIPQRMLQVLQLDLNTRGKRIALTNRELFNLTRSVTFSECTKAIRSLLHTDQ